MSLFLGAHGVGASVGGVVEPRFLKDALAGVEDFGLAQNFVFESGANEAERVYVLDLSLGAELLLAARTQADVGIAAQAAFFHVAVGDRGVEKYFLEQGEVLVGLVRRAHVGFGDDFDERRATAIEVDAGPRGRVGEPVVDALAGVFFHVQTGDTDAFGAVWRGHGELAVFREGLVKLRDLVALGRVRIEVILAREDGVGADLAADGGGGQSGEFHRAAIENRQSSGQAEACGADVGIGRRAVLVATSAERLCLGQQLDMNFEPDDRLVASVNIRQG